MEGKFDQLVTTFNTSPFSTDVLREITLRLKEQTTESLSSFINQSIQSLLILKYWTWKTLSEDFHQWIDQQIYQEFFDTFASFIKKVIYHYDNIAIETKASLIFPETIDQVNSIFQQIEQDLGDNESFIKIVSLWLDNHSYFNHDNPQYDTSSITDYIVQYIVHHYIMSKQYKLYLSPLRQPSSMQIIFTAKMLFYIRTCPFYLYACMGVKVQNFPYTAEDILHYISNDYLQIIHSHSYTVASWSKELLGCIAQLVGLVCGCCWWDGEKKSHIKVLFPTEQIVCNHVEDLIRIIGHKPFYKQTKSVRSNDETTLMDSIFMLLIIIVQTQNISWLFRSNTTIRDTIVSASEAALNDEVSLCGYVILGETLSDEDLKNLKIADNIGNYFFHVLEQAWYHSSKKYKQVPLPYLLKGKSLH
jgi:hypothetical protein